MADRAEPPLPTSIADEAARWQSESFDGALPPERQAALDAWLAADPRHARTYAEMRALWADMAAVPETPALRASLAAPEPRRRRERWMREGGRRRLVAPAIAASLALLAVGAVEDWPMRLQADAMTATGERRTIALPDGSSVQLDTGSAVAVDFDGRRRMVRLLKGEAAFAVAPEPARPFTVAAGGGSTTALGTRFLVRRDGDETGVVVTEHSVRVVGPGGGSAVVGEGQGLVYGGAGGIGAVTTVNSGDAMAWTEGVLVFKDAPLATVVDEIGRYHRGYVRVLGDARALRVSGVFRVDDPVAALDQLQRSLGLRSTRLTDRLILISG